MNILHHKSWHVWNKDNLARVVKDEQEAAEQEKKKQKRIDLAEQETRLTALRKRAKQHSSEEEDEKPQATVTTATTHVNLFLKEEEEARSKGTFKPNDEYEEEERRKKQKQERSVTVYLGEGSAELSDKKPWYVSNTATFTPSADDQSDPAKAPPTSAVSKFSATTKEERSKRRRDGAIKREDPLTDVNKYLHMKAARTSNKTLDNKLPYKVAPAIGKDDDKLAKLRQDRLLRESEEHMRVAQLKGLPIPKVADARPRYNQQFNPEFTRSTTSRPPAQGRYSDKYRNLLATGSSSRFHG